MFKHLFDSLLQGMTVSWAEYIQKNTDSGLAFRDMFYENLYRDAFFLLLFVSVLTTFIYYLYLNANFGTYYSLKWYFFLMLTNSCVIFIASQLILYYSLKRFNCPTGPHIFSLSVISFVYGLITFFIISMLLKWFSPMGKKTPF